jgi:lysozyme
MIPFALGIDVSFWEPYIDWPLLKAGGMSFVIVRASQGNGNRDVYLRRHVEGAISAGLAVGAYHWCDPLMAASDQAECFCDCIGDLPVSFVAVDVEQYWRDWAEYRARKITKIIAPTTISQVGRETAGIIKARTSAPVLVYTRKSFILEWARPMLEWIRSYPLWLAQWPYKPGIEETTWEDFTANHLPVKSGPDLPPGCDHWTFWQFSGEKFRLPGVWQDAAKKTRASLDINFFNGSEADLRQWCALPLDPPAPLPPVPPPTLPAKVKVLVSGANIRNAPEITLASDVGDLVRGRLLDVIGDAGQFWKVSAYVAKSVVEVV